MFKFLNKFDDLFESLLFFVAAIITGGFGDRIIPHTLLEFLGKFFLEGSNKIYKGKKKVFK